MGQSYTFEIVAADSGWLARCIELEVEAIGPTREAAVTELRRALSAKLNDVQGVGAADVGPSVFELVERVAPMRDPSGPGDVAPVRGEGSPSR